MFKMMLRVLAVVAGGALILSALLAVVIWFGILRDLQDRNVDNDGLQPSPTIAASVAGYDRYNKCEWLDLAQEWDCFFHGDVFVIEGDIPEGNRIEESDVSGVGWIHGWMEFLAGALLVFAGAFLIFLGVAPRSSKEENG